MRQPDDHDTQEHVEYLESEGDCSASDMPLAAALEFAESGRSTGGEMTHDALKTLAATIRNAPKENSQVRTQNEQ